MFRRFDPTNKNYRNYDNRFNNNCKMEITEMLDLEYDEEKNAYKNPNYTNK